MYKEYIELYNTYTQKYGTKTAIFLMVGSFYELYDTQDEQGNTACNVREIVDILSIQLSAKQEGDQKCLFAGFPDYVMHKWAGRLTSAGWTVVIVDQIKGINGKVKERKVSRILSPSTHIENIPSNETAYIGTLFIEQQSHGPPQIGAAMVDLTTGKTMTYATHASGLSSLWTADDIVQLLHVYPPRELVVYSKGVDESHIRKLTTLATVHIRPLDTVSAFDKELVRTEYLQKVYRIASLLPPRTYLGIRSLYEEYALIYLLQFVEEHLASMVTALHRNEPWTPDMKLICGNHALSQLQMSSDQGILSLFTKCITAMGKRGIRERILSPYSNAATIQTRLNEVTNYISWSKERVASVEQQLRFMYDLPRLHRKIICASITFDEIVGLFQTYRSIETLSRILSDTLLVAPFSTEMWHEYMTVFRTHYSDDKPPFLSSTDQVRRTPFNIATYPDIGEKEAHIQFVMERLDALRKEYNQLMKQDFIRIEEREKEPFGFKASTIMLKQLKKLPNLPAGTVLTELKSGGWIDCTELQVINKEISTLREQLQRLVSSKQLDACQAIATQVPIWSLMEEWICHVDGTQCIGRTAQEHAWSCPVIQEGTAAFDIKQIRHPLVECSASRISYVMHDIALGSFSVVPGSNEDKNGWLVYGMNASGKSTLMKATGICILLAQAGCYVPAKHMTLSPFQAVYTRILNQDNIHAGLSSFAVEMSELRDILRNANENTLVLGDELCAGTESVSAQALVASGIQWLQKKQTKFIFATHLHDLATLVKGIQIWHLHVEYDPVTKKLIYDRSLRQGSGSSLYGLEVARAMDLPFEFIEQALKFRENIVGSTKEGKPSSWNTQIVRKECEICMALIVTDLEVHHIQPRASATNGVLQDGTHMNDKRNLIVICQRCHDKVHAETIEIGALQMTSNGPERIVKEKQVMKKNKWSEEEMKIVMDTLHKYSSLSSKAIRARLSQHESIEMSETVIGKLRREMK
jgi:DNA mismatch repair protein MutS